MNPITSSFTAPGPVVLVLVPGGGVWHLVMDYDNADCPLCHNERELRVWNPELRDELSYALTPVSEHTLTVTCPACRPRNTVSEADQ